MVDGVETWVLRKEVDGVLQRAGRALVKRLCGVKLTDRKRSMQESMPMVGLNEDVVTYVRRLKLRWYEHVLRLNELAGNRALKFEVECVIGRGRPQLGWRGQVEKDRVKAGCGMF